MHKATLVLAVALAAAVPAAAAARTAVIELAAPVQDQSNDSIREAVQNAVEQATQGAAAMGLPYVDLQDAEMVGDTVAIQLLASDTPPTDSHGGNNASSDQPDVSNTSYQAGR